MAPKEKQPLDRSFQEALRHFRRGELGKARSLAEQLLRIHPAHHEALHLLGIMAYQARDLVEALALIGKAIGICPHNALFQHSQGLVLLAMSRPEEAIAAFDRAIQLKPDYFDAYINRGNALQRTLRPAEAVASYDLALQIKPNSPAAYNNRGVALKNRKRFDEAIASFDLAIELDPGYHEAFNNRGNALLEANRPEEAITAYDRAIQIKPDYHEAFNNRGNVLLELNRTEEAIAAYDRAIQIKPDYHEAHYNRGNALQKTMRLAEAISAFDRAIQLRPGYHDAYYNRAVTLKRMLRFDEAIASYEQALELRPDNPETFNNRGVVFQEMMRFDDAIASYEQAIRLKPDYADAFNNRGVAFQEMLRLDDAIASYEQAVRLKPDFADSHWNRSLALLLKGEFEQGWKHYEWRWKKEPLSSAKRDYRQPLWLGNAPLRGKTILIYSEQGYGDTLQFCRYARLLTELGARVVLEVEPALTSLLGTLEGVGQLVPRGRELPPFDYHCPLMSLPLAFGTTLETIPCPGKYLRADPAAAGLFSDLLGTRDRPRIGIAWNGGHRENQPELWAVNARRNIPFDKVARLASLPLDFVSLQKGEPAESELEARREQLWPDGNLLALSGKLTDFAATAALVEQLDLVIAVDTSVAHLAAALGKPVWLLNRYDTCWRWLLDREETPWYPTMKIYRQPAMGDWDPVIDRVFEDLRNRFFRQLPAQARGSNELHNDPLDATAPGQRQSPPESEMQNTRLQGRLRQAIGLLQQGNLTAAESLGEEILHGHPGHADALHLLGTIAFESRQYLEAAELIGKAIENYPHHAVYFYTLGNALQKLSRLDEAIAAYDRAIQLKPDYHEAHSNRGVALKNNRQLAEAIASFNRAIQLKPDFADAFNNRGNALQELGRIDEAVASYDHAILLRPDFADAFNNRGIALKKLNRVEEAIDAYDRAILIKPDFADAFNNRGIALQQLSRVDEAIDSYDRAIRIRPDFADAFNNRGVALRETLRVDKAIDSYDQAIRIKPDHDEARFSKSLALLLRGEFETGWNLFEERWNTKLLSSAKRAYRQPLWLGKEPIAGKTILLHSEQGLGDTIQFCRYARLVAGLGALVVLEADPSLTSLLGTLDGVDLLVAKGRELPPFDCHCPLMSLPLAFGTTLETIPCPGNYLRADPAATAFFNKLLGKRKRPRIGLAWNGGYRKHHPELWAVNSRRNLPFDRMARLASLPLDFVSLQKGEPAESELLAGKERLWPDGNLLVLTEQLTDFAATAALIGQLDLVIAVDTSVAHLAAALGKPVWLLNRYDTCWRWLLDRQDSPWYPTMKIYRQQSMGEWDPVIDRVIEDLQKLVDG